MRLEVVHYNRTSPQSIALLSLTFFSAHLLEHTKWSENNVLTWMLYYYYFYFYQYIFALTCRWTSASNWFVLARFNRRFSNLFIYNVNDCELATTRHAVAGFHYKKLVLYCYVRWAPRDDDDDDEREAWAHFSYCTRKTNLFYFKTNFYA